MIEIEFPNIGKATFKLNDSPDHPAHFINKHGPEWYINKGLETIRQAENARLSFEPDSALNINGTTYKRLYIHMSGHESTDGYKFHFYFSGTSENKKGPSRNAGITPKAHEKLKQTYGDALRAVYTRFIDQAKETAEKEYMETILREVEKAEKQLLTIRGVLGVPVSIMPDEIKIEKTVKPRKTTDKLSFLGTKSWYKPDYSRRMAAIGKLSAFIVRDQEYRYKDWLAMDTQERIKFQDQPLPGYYK